jgi:hypothetical protein
MRVPVLTRASQKKKKKKKTTVKIFTSEAISFTTTDRMLPIKTVNNPKAMPFIVFCSLLIRDCELALVILDTLIDFWHQC